MGGLGREAEDRFEGYPLAGIPKPFTLDPSVVPLPSSFQTPARIASVTLAILAVASSLTGWGLVEVLEAATRLAPGVEDAVDPSRDLVDTADATLDELGLALDSARAVSGQISASADDVADVVEEVADLTTGQIAGTLTALEASLPALADTAAVVDDSMRALSLFGVEYTPSVPLDEAIGDVQAEMEGLPEALAAQGAQLETLTPQIRSSGQEMERLGDSLGSIREDLSSASEIIGRYRVAIDGLGESSVVAAQISAWIPIIRVGLVLIGVGGLVLAVAVWIGASRWHHGTDTFEE